MPENTVSNQEQRTPQKVDRPQSEYPQQTTQRGDLLRRIDSLVDQPDTALRAVVGETSLTLEDRKTAAAQKLESAVTDIREQRLENPQQFADALVDAHDASIDGIAELLTNIANSRAVNSPVRDKYPLPSFFDRTVVTLIQADQVDLLSRITTSSPNEIAIINQAITNEIADPEEQALLRKRFQGIHTEKQRMFTDTLSAQSVDSKIQKQLLTSTHNPEAALALGTHFWQIFPSLPETAKQQLLQSADMRGMADQLMAITSHGLLDHMTPQLFVSLSRKFTTNEEREAFLTSLQQANELIPDNKARAKMHFSKESVMHTLMQFAPVPSGFIHEVVALQNYFNQLKEPETGFGETIKYALMQEDPVAASEKFRQAFEKSEDLLKSNKITYNDIIKSGDPIAFADALDRVQQFVPSEKHSLKQRLVLRRTPKNVDHRLKNYGLAEVAFQKQNISIQTMSEADVAILQDMLRKPMNQEHIEVICRDWQINREHNMLLGQLLDKASESGDSKDFGPRITLDRMPLLQERFTSLGIDQKRASEMFASWYSFNAYKKARYDLKLDGKQPTKKQEKDIIKKSKELQADTIAQQIGALTTYAENYGNESLQQIIDTFGIYHFMRYQPDHLNNQLKRWQDGTDVPKNILVGARTDWNNFMKESGSDARMLFGQEGLYCFEVNDSESIAKVAVAIGNRDRKNGRDPLVSNSVENFIITAHGSPEGMALGINGEYLRPSDYVFTEGEDTHAKPNTYKRHLGNVFRLILKSCETAGRARQEENIATAMGEGHNVQTEASENVVTRIIINPDNSVTFEDGEGNKTASTTYNPA